VRDLTDKEIKEFEIYCFNMIELDNYYDLCHKNKWPKSKSPPLYWDDYNIDYEKFTKFALVDSLGYNQIYNGGTNNMDICDDDLDSGEFHYERWILFANDIEKQFGFLICSESTCSRGNQTLPNKDNEFIECRSIEDILKLRNTINNSIVWKNKTDMRSFLSSEEIKKMPWKIKNLKKTCQGYKDTEKEFQDFLKECVKLLDNQKD